MTKGGGKVLYVDSSASGYGGEVCLLDMVARLSARGFEPLVILPEEGVLTEKLREKGISFRVMPLAVIDRRIFKPAGFVRFWRNFIPSIVVLRRIIKEEKVALVHTNTSIVLSGAIAAKLARVPHIWHIREIFDAQLRCFWFFLKYFIIFFSDRIICISEAVKCEFCERGVARIDVVYDGIDPAVWSFKKGERRSLDRFGVTPDEISVVMVGRINRWKGQDVFLRAAKLVAKRIPGVKFLIVGDYRREYAEIAEELFRMVEGFQIKEKVVFTGYLEREEVVELTASSDIVVHASKKAEPFGMTVIEAMALGKSVVASAAGGPLETVQDGITGMLVAPGDFQGMADAIVRLAENPALRERMGEMGRERAIRLFDIKDTIDKIDNLYRRTIIKK